MTAKTRCLVGLSKSCTPLSLKIEKMESEKEMYIINISCQTIVGRLWTECGVCGESKVGGRTDDEQTEAQTDQGLDLDLPHGTAFSRGEFCADLSQLSSRPWLSASCVSGQTAAAP